MSDGLNQEPIDQTRPLACAFTPLTKRIVGLILIVVAIFWLSTIRAGHCWADDFAMYVHHAKNIAEGNPYENVKLIPNPYHPLYAPRSTPPLFPVLLVPVYAIAGLDMTAFKLVPVVSFLLALLPIFRLVSYELSCRSSIAVLLVLGFAPYLWNFKDEIRADYVFLLFIYCALLLLHNHFHEPRERVRLIPDSPAIVGVLLFLAYATRPAAVVLLGCALLFDFRRHHRVTKYSVILTITFGFLAVGQHLLFPSTGYAAQAVASGRGPGFYTLIYIITPAVFWANGHSHGVMLLLFVVTTAIAIAGFALRLRRRRTVLELFFGLYLLALIIWPTYEHLRYLIPVLPLYIFYLFGGLEHLATVVPPRAGRILLPLVLAIILVNFAVAYTAMDLHTVPEGLADPETQELLTWVRTSTPEDATIVFYRARLLSLFTGRAAATLNDPKYAATIWSYWKEIDADYLIVSYFDKDFWRDFARTHADKLPVVFRSADFTVHKIALQE